TYDCIQVHGGSGFMMEYACQRLYRDARITSIYEGTTQLQVVAAIRYVTNGTYTNILRDLAAGEVIDEMKPLMARVSRMTDRLESVVNLTKENQDPEYHDLMARHLYEIAAVTVMAGLLVKDASSAPELFSSSARVYVNLAEAEVAKHASFVENFSVDQVADYRK
ncbi:MAG: acyl-CoA dehydrogenase family protein, partial [Bacteroidales bacterium]|nr:acyl-CoA dehydrogenase family protein [Bacteroidales bacterium]